MTLALERRGGAGVDLVAACARRVASPEASFRMPGLRFGLVLGSRLFAQRVGGERARQVLEISQTFNATDAQAWGFLTAVAPQERWDAMIDEAAAAVAQLPPESAARLYAVTTPDTRDADLAELVRSAARPGLKQRISEYLAQKG